ncbi:MULTISPECIES: hypothetical protein [Vibrio]|uniref:hypothetical protein n=1 Tax=Vibrio TaxID=662 RepID=UPI0020758B04|nr:MULTISPECIES: hypothetical protein [Vibrio]USD35611.1 hypothetical protein J8Z27_22650 [Vibrio sp. SCSIO 43186]USD72735.1 hypothetical protein J4N41_22655 [Vibrio sp. SCSIO 43139]USD98940.1 hypothetical protein CTT30_22980 [Vibrio coralliilyticus]
MKEAKNNTQLVDELLKLHDVENDNQLAQLYGVQRQQINQFRQASRVGLPQMIMSNLLDMATKKTKGKIR